MPNGIDQISHLFEHPEVKRIVRNVNDEVIERRNYHPPVCEVFANQYTRLIEDDRYRFSVHPEAVKRLSRIIDNKVQSVAGPGSSEDTQKNLFSRVRNIGIVFSGGPAPGGHNVIAGIYDAAKKANPENRLFGFLLGPDGIIENEAIEITGSLVDKYRNLGGFTMIKTGRTKIDTREKVALSRETCKQLQLDALVIVGGDDSNTNAAFLAQEMFEDGIQIIGVPKTIDGDIQVRDADGKVLCAMSFGFHTAARAFAKAIGNLCTDSGSDVKYWHICKVMGRVASHLAREVALQTHANITFIGEDLANYIDTKRIAAAEKEGTTDYTGYGMTLRHLSRVICDGILRRAAVGKNHGVIVIPEGILEFINEIQIFIIKLNTIIAKFNKTHDIDFHKEFPRLDDKLEYLRRLVRGIRKDNPFAIWNRRDDELFNDLPEFFRKGLLNERDSHGNFQFSQVETEKVILKLVKDYLKILREKGRYRIGVSREQCRKMFLRQDLDPDLFGRILFENFDTDDLYLLTRTHIYSYKTLTQALLSAGVITADESVPAAVTDIYRKSVPKLRTQLHFYGYDGRGSDPTRFDCIYTYNLGLTAFSLIANGATGQMAAIKNLEKDFSLWEPIGIPIAPLMHLEERKGRLELVLEKSLVSVDSVSFKVLKACREKWLAATPGPDNYRRSGPIRFAGKSEETRPMTLILNALADHSTETG
jgi:diphosphate-dependent phosphofructokinase